MASWLDLRRCVWECLLVVFEKYSTVSLTITPQARVSIEAMRCFCWVAVEKSRFSNDKTLDYDDSGRRAALMGQHSALHRYVFNVKVIDGFLVDVNWKMMFLTATGSNCCNVSSRTSCPILDLDRLLWQLQVDCVQAYSRKTMCFCGLSFELTDGLYLQYGDRIPGVWFWPGEHRLHVVDGMVSHRIITFTSSSGEYRIVNIALWIIITLHTWLMLPVRFHSNHHSYYHSTYTYNLITTMQTKISYSFTTHDGVLGSRFTMRYSQCDIHNAIFTTARCPRTSMDFWQSACVVHALDLKLMKVEWYLAVFGQRQLLPRRTAPSRRAFGRGNQVHVYITTFIICCYCCHVYITTFIWQQ